MRKCVRGTVLLESKGTVHLLGKRMENFFKTAQLSGISTNIDRTLPSRRTVPLLISFLSIIRYVPAHVSVDKVSLQRYNTCKGR